MYLEVRSLAQKLDDQQQQHDSAAQGTILQGIFYLLL